MTIFPQFFISHVELGKLIFFFNNFNICFDLLYYFYFFLLNIKVGQLFDHDENRNVVSMHELYLIYMLLMNIKIYLN